MKIRPITVMVGLAVLVAMAAVTVSWLPSDDAVTVGEPASLPISVGAEAAAAMAPTSTLVGPPTYLRGAGLDDGFGDQIAYTFPADPARPSAIRTLAGALGVDGVIQPTSSGWRVAGPDSTELDVSSQPGSTWTYSSGGMSATTTCIAPSPPSEPSAGSAPGVSIEGDAVVANCGQPAPVDGLPDPHDAETRARRLWHLAGLTADAGTVTTEGDEWTTTVRSAPVLDGTPVVGLDSVVTFGGQGVIAYATGWLGAPVRADSYPLIGTDAAIARLQAGRDLLGPVEMVSMGSTTSGTTETTDAFGSDGSTGATNPVGTGAVSGPATTVVCGGDCPPSPPTTIAPGTAGTSAAVPGATPGNPADPSGPPTTIYPPPDAGPATPLPTPTPTVVPTPITITSVTVVLVAAPGHDGSTWLVPGYELKAGAEPSATSWYVLAVDDSFLAPPSAKPPTGVEPMPYAHDDGSSSSPGSSAVTPQTATVEPPPTTGTTQPPRL